MTDEGDTSDSNPTSNRGYVIGWSIAVVGFCAMFLWYLLSK
jgi:hypothetical protein